MGLFSVLKVSETYKIQLLRQQSSAMEQKKEAK